MNFINNGNFNEPRLKRKCVLQNEAKSKDWWSDDEEEDDDEEENVANGKEESEKKVDDNSNADIKQDSDSGQSFLTLFLTLSKCSLLIPLKTLENLWLGNLGLENLGLSDVSREIKREHQEKG